MEATKLKNVSTIEDLERGFVVLETPGGEKIAIGLKDFKLKYGKTEKNDNWIHKSEPYYIARLKIEHGK